MILKCLCPHVGPHCYSIKLKATVYRYNMSNFQFIGLRLSIFIDNSVKKDLLMIHSKI